MAYNEIGFVNNNPPAINANNLNHMEKGIKDASTNIDTLLGNYHLGKNRENPNEEVSGYLGTDGSIVSHSTWKTTGFCYIGDLTQICSSARYKSTGNRNRYALYFMCTYNANKEFIEQVYTSTTTSIWTRTSGVAYIRFSYQYQTYDKVQIESGDTPTAFEDYTMYVNENNLPVPVQMADSNIKSSTKRMGVIGNNTALVAITSDFTLSDGYIQNTGKFIAYSSSKSTDFIDIYEYPDLYVTGDALYPENCLYCLYDENHNFIMYYKDNLSENDYHFFLPDFIDTYPRAKYVRFSSVTGTLLKIKRPANTAEIIAMIGGAETKIWQGKKWVCVGDSLTEVNSRTTMHYHDYIHEETGITVVNMGVSGSGYRKLYDENKAFYQRISNVPTDADVVTIFGSGNDGSSGLEIGNPTDTGLETLCGCINTTIDNLIARMPKVSLGIVSPTPWVGQDPADTTNWMTRYSNALKTICEYRSIPFLDLYHCSNLRPWTQEGRQACYTKDNGNGVHPDESGHKLIAPRFKVFVESLLYIGGNE